MKRVRLPDLSMSLEEDGRVLVRAPTRGIGAHVPPVAVGILAFCGSARDEAEVQARFGPTAVPLFRGLVDAGLLVEPGSVEGGTVFFDNFAAVDIHRRMLADRARVEAYEKAIGETVRTGAAVMDAGTGSGLLAAFAARAGARVVYAVDNSDILSVATEVARRSALPAIRTIKGNFGAVKLPEPVDVLVTETFGALALAEGAAPDLRAAVRDHLADDGVVVPHAVTLWLAPVVTSWARDEILGPLAAFPGIDLSVLAESALCRGVTLAFPPDAVGPEAKLATIPWPCEDEVLGVVHLALEAGTTWYGLCGWFDLHLSQATDLSTGPRAKPTHWGQVYLPMEPREASGPVTGRIGLRPALDDPRALELSGEWADGATEWRTFHRIR